MLNLLLLPLLAPTVTYENAGASASKVVPEIGAKAGVSLQVSPIMATEVLCVRLDKAPLNEVLAKIAFATDGSWDVKADGTRWLVRTPQNAQLARVRERAEQMAAAKEFFDELTQSAEPFTEHMADQLAKSAKSIVENFKDRGNSWELARKVMEKSPGTSLKLGILRAIPIEEVADLEEGDALTFSSNPTRMQRPLRSSVAAALRQYDLENQRMREAFQRYGVTNPTIDGGTYMLFNDLQESGRVAKVLVKLARQGPMISMRIRVVDGSGKYIATFHEQIMTGRKLMKTMSETKQTEAAIEMPADVQDFGRMLAGETLEPAKLKGVRPVLLNPEKAEPISYGLGRVMVLLAKKQNQNLVISAPDYAGGFPIGSSQGMKVTPSVLQGFTRFMFEIQEEGSWCVARPRAANWNWRVRVPRPLLGTYLRRIASDTPLTLDEEAAFAWQLPESTPGLSLTSMLERALLPEKPYRDERFLRLYGSLSARQREVAKKGLPVSDLNPKQLALLTRIVFTSEQLNVDYQELQSRKSSGQVMTELHNSTITEPTEALPTGLPPETVLQLTDSTMDAVFSPPSRTASGGRRASETLVANQLAYRMYRAQQPESLSEWERDLPMDSFRVGTQRNVNVSVKLGKVYSCEGTLSERKYNGDRYLRYTELPAAFRTEVEKHVESFRSMKIETSPSNRKTPPPVR